MCIGYFQTSWELYCVHSQIVDIVAFEIISLIIQSSSFSVDTLMHYAGSLQQLQVMQLHFITDVLW